MLHTDNRQHINSLLEARREMMNTLSERIYHAKLRIQGMGEELEVFDNKKHVQEKIDYATDLRAYFMDKLVAGDVKTIE